MNLVTGATGLVGAHLVLQLLQQGKSVVAIKRQGSDVLKTKKIYFCLWLMASPVYKAHIAKIFGMKTNQSDYIFEDIVSNYSGKVVSLTEISKELETYLASLGIHLKEDVQFPPKTKYKFQKQ